MSTTSFRGTPPRRVEAAPERRHGVGRGLRVRVDHGVRGREGQRRDEAVGAAAGALAHRHVDAGVPPVGLQELAGRVARAPEVAGGLELRAHARQVVLQDGDAAGVTQALPPDLTPAIRSWFKEAGFREKAFDVSHDGFMSVGAHRLTGEPSALVPGQRLFTFAART